MQYDLLLYLEDLKSYQGVRKVFTNGQSDLLDYIGARSLRDHIFYTDLKTKTLIILGMNSPTKIRPKWVLKAATASLISGRLAGVQGRKWQ